MNLKVAVLVVLFFLILVSLCIILASKRQSTAKKFVLEGEKKPTEIYKPGMLVTTLGGNGAPRHVLTPTLLRGQPHGFLQQHNGNLYVARCLNGSNQR